MSLDPIVLRRHNVQANCRDCGRLLIVNVLIGKPENLRGATLQATDVFEQNLGNLVCSVCTREAQHKNC